MVSRGRLAERSLRRSPPRLTVRPRILLVCEGISTEPGYFNDLKQELQTTLIDVDVDSRGGTPKTLVERAVTAKKAAEAEARRAKDENLKYEEVWCVYDVDEHPKLEDARQQAEAHGIRLAISNPCFELWILLHFQDQRAYIERHAAHLACRGYMPAYVKRVDYRLLVPGYTSAVRRALELEDRHARDEQPGANPSTGVVHLTERLRRYGRQEQLRLVAER